MGGQIVDASVVPAPKQRNSKAEKAAIREGRMPDGWEDNPAKARQKDRDARWTVKYTKAKVKEAADPKGPRPVDLAVPMFGYKNDTGIVRARVDPDLGRDRRPGGRGPSGSPGPVPRARRSGMSSPGRSTRWAWSSAPSVYRPEPGQRSASPTSPTTSDQFELEDETVAGRLGCFLGSGTGHLLGSKPNQQLDSALVR